MAKGQAPVLCHEQILPGDFVKQKPVRMRVIYCGRRSPAPSRSKSSPRTMQLSSGYSATASRGAAPFMDGRLVRQFLESACRGDYVL